MDAQRTSGITTSPVFGPAEGFTPPLLRHAAGPE